MLTEVAQAFGAHLNATLNWCRHPDSNTMFMCLYLKRYTR